MTLITARVEVHHTDDVTFSVDTGQFLDALGPTAQHTEDTLNEVLDAYVEQRAYYSSECWYHLLSEPDSERVLKHALATTLRVETDDLSGDDRFCTSNWENNLTEDFGGTLWSTAHRRLLTIESGDRGLMNLHVQARELTCEEPEYVIRHCSSEVMIGCTHCDLVLDTAHERITWAELTRTDADGWAEDGLFCPKCQQPMRAEVWI